VRIITDNELSLLKNKLNKAEKIKTSINNIDKIIENIKNGECTEISYNYHAPSKGLPFQLDYEGEGDYCYIQRINHTSLGFSESQYHECFSKPLRDYIITLKENLQKELEELK